MISIFKGKRFTYVVLFSVILILALVGCGGSSGKGAGNGDVIDLTKYVGTWESPDRVSPKVEFTIGEFIETVELPSGDGTKICHYFKGSVKCTILEGGQIDINDKPGFLPPARIDHIVVEEIGDTILLYVKAGHDAMEGGTVDITHGQLLDSGRITTYTSIENEGSTVYETPGFDDVFTKQ